MSDTPKEVMKYMMDDEGIHFQFPQQFFFINRKDIRDVRDALNTYLKHLGAVDSRGRAVEDPCSQQYG